MTHILYTALHSTYCKKGYDNCLDLEGTQTLTENFDIQYVQ